MIPSPAKAQMLLLYLFIFAYISLLICWSIGLSIYSSGCDPSLRGSLASRIAGSRSEMLPQCAERHTVIGITLEPSEAQGRWAGCLRNVQTMFKIFPHWGQSKKQGFLMFGWKSGFSHCCQPKPREGETVDFS